MQWESFPQLIRERCYIRQGLFRAQQKCLIDSSINSVNFCFCLEKMQIGGWGLVALTVVDLSNTSAQFYVHG